MFPTIVTIGPFTIRTYGVMVALGFFFALSYIARRAARRGIPENFVLDLGLYAIVAGLAGARLTYVLENGQYYATRLPEILKVWEGGLVYYGGFIAGAAAILFYVRRRRVVRVLALGDLVAPALALGHFFGRLGCFFAGCCFGIPANVPWAVTFCSPESLAPAGIPRHPTQLYEAAGNLVIFFLLDRYDRRSHAEGNTLALYLFLYGMLRFNVEFLRGDERGAFVMGFSQGQLISLALIVLSLGFLVFHYGKNHTDIGHERTQA